MIRSRFPNTDETSAFILARLISDAHCLVCGNHAPDQAINEYNSRIASVACVVCGTDLHGENNLLSGAEFADAAIASIAAKLASTAEQLESSEQTRTEAEQVFNESVVELATLDSNISARSARIDFLLRQLPPEESKRREQLSELSLLRRRLEELKLELTDKLTAFGTFVEAENRSIQEASDRIKTAFASFATGFLLESCALIWAPYMSRVGQTGEPMLFPAFGLEMTGSNFTAPTRREGPDQVSESQREFIDLAFRMALMQVSSATPDAATLVIDAPESSLDAVFSERATDVLARFGGSGNGNRLLITSNLTSGTLLPNLIRQSLSSREEAASRVINLLLENTRAARRDEPLRQLLLRSALPGSHGIVDEGSEWLWSGMPVTVPRLPQGWAVLRQSSELQPWPMPFTSTLVISGQRFRSTTRVSVLP